MLTSPKLMLPFQIARIPKVFRAARASCAGEMSILRGGVEFVAGDPAQLKKPDQRFFDHVVRTGGAGRDANDSRSMRQPVSRNHFRLLMQIIVFDLVARKKPGGVEHKI